ncbi:MAG: iron-only hydrogenase system regulator [Firmicutes bacterium]|nr:iron-only hydrogenase system regulator [Bacillota bacterium]
METRIAIIGIIIERIEASTAVNAVLHDYSEYIIGRMGLPYKEKNLNVISIVVDAPCDAINTMAGRLGNIEGVSAKAVYSKNK